MCTTLGRSRAEGCVEGKARQGRGGVRGFRVELGSLMRQGRAEQGILFGVRGTHFITVILPYPSVSLQGGPQRHRGHRLLAPSPSLMTVGGMGSKS